MLRMILIVGSGGFAGSVARYLGQVFINKYYPSSFPLGTFTINVLGCFLIGMIYAFSEKGNIMKPEILMFLATGFCGGFTTFSTFSYDVLQLFKDREILIASGYISLSVFLGILAAYLGVVIVKAI